MKLWQTLFDPKAALHPPMWSADGPLISTRFGGDREQIANDFEGYVHAAYKANGIVFACILARMLVFSEARFGWRNFDESGRPSALFNHPGLSLLERPWPNATTGELLGHMEQDASLAGNFFASPVGRGVNRRIRRMRPDWVTIVTGVRRDELRHPDEKPSPFDMRAVPVAYVYRPPGQDPTILLPDEVAHYSPIPDPVAQWRGMSWLTPVLNEIGADKAASKHKLNFFRNGAVPGLAISYDKALPKEEVAAYIEMFKEEFDGFENAYRTLHMGGGADPKIVGADLKQIDFKTSQGHGETRIAAAAGTHPVIVGLSEGMQGSSLNAGNYVAIRRRFADGTIRPLWRIASASLQKLVPAPNATAGLWYDDRDVQFMREDAKDAAVIQRTRVGTLNALISNGWTPESAKAYLASDEMSDLDHSGLLSVQLQSPGEGGEQIEAPTAVAARLIKQGWTVVPTNGRAKETV